MAANLLINAEEARLLRGGGRPNIAGYQRWLDRLDDGQVLRVEMGGEDDEAVQEENFRQAAGEMGIEVGFSHLNVDDNVPYLIVTRNPNYVRPHLPGQ